MRFTVSTLTTLGDLLPIPGGSRTEVRSEIEVDAASAEEAATAATATAHGLYGHHRGFRSIDVLSTSATRSADGEPGIRCRVSHVRYPQNVDHVRIELGRG